MASIGYSIVKSTDRAGCGSSVNNTVGDRGGNCCTISCIDIEASCAVLTSARCGINVTVCDTNGSARIVVEEIIASAFSTSTDCTVNSTVGNGRIDSHTSIIIQVETSLTIQTTSNTRTVDDVIKTVGDGLRQSSTSIARKEEAIQTSRALTG